jgi:hypothetical protein
MTVSRTALAPDVTRRDLDHAVANASATIAVGNGPTLVLVIGPDATGRPVEATGVIRDEDVLFVHAAPMRSEYQVLLERAVEQPGARSSIPSPHQLDRWSVDGIELSDENVALVRERAINGHDIEILRRRLRPGRPAPLAIGDVVRVEFDPPTYAALSDEADAEGVSIAAVTRRRFDAYLAVHAATPSASGGREHRATQMNPEALGDGISEDDVLWATEHALITTHNGNGPTLLFILGNDESGRMLEASAIVRHEDVLVVHADVARDEYLTLLDEVQIRDNRAASYGSSADGMRLTEEAVAELTAAAEKGHDVDFLLDRTRPGRPAPMTVGTVVRVALGRDQGEQLRHLAGTGGVSRADLLVQILRS